MKKLKSSTELKMQREQFGYLIDLLTNARNRNEILGIMEIVLTQSEKGVISQRLEILRLLNSGARYDDIESDLRVSPTTISSVLDQYTRFGEHNTTFKKLVRDTKRKVEKTKPNRYIDGEPIIGVRSMLRENRCAHDRKKNKK